MADKTGIEWTDATWNPIRARNKATGKVGWYCEKVSPGCETCYACRFNEVRLGTGLPYKPGHRKDVDIFLDEKTLLQPLRWKKPRKIFVCSMTDLFGEWVPDEWIAMVFAIMALTPWHTFQVLTKRSKRMREYCRLIRPQYLDAQDEICEVRYGSRPTAITWPLPNVWLGVSAEDQTRADERVPDLLATPAAVRFVSAEPLLGVLDMRQTLDRAGMDPVWGLRQAGLHWVIVGGESGPRARPMHPDWARGLRDQCKATGTAFHFKQWGEWIHADQPGVDMLGTAKSHMHDFGDGHHAVRVGKKSAGRMLDGVLHGEYPGVE